MLTFEAEIAREFLAGAFAFSTLLITCSCRVTVGFRIASCIVHTFEFCSRITLSINSKGHLYQNRQRVRIHTVASLFTPELFAFAGSTFFAISIIIAGSSIGTRCAAVKFCCLTSTKNINSKGNLYPNMSTMVGIETKQTLKSPHLLGNIYHVCLLLRQKLPENPSVGQSQAPVLKTHVPLGSLSGLVVLQVASSTHLNSV